LATNGPATKAITAKADLENCILKLMLWRCRDGGDDLVDGVQVVIRRRMWKTGQQQQQGFLLGGFQTAVQFCLFFFQSIIDLMVPVSIHEKVRTSVVPSFSLMCFGGVTFLLYNSTTLLLHSNSTKKPTTNILKV
jgi:hypothetical protein